MSYRSYYKERKPLKNTKNILKNELASLQEELQELRERSAPRQRYNSDFGNIIDNKVLLFGGLILFGIAIAYFLFNPNSNRCKC